MMTYLKLALLTLLLWLCPSASAQTVYIGGMLTDSSASAAVPPIPAWASKVQVAVDYRSRYRYWRETDFITYQGTGQCDFTINGYIGQHATVWTNGAKLGGGRTTAPFSQFGTCVPFDGVNDGAGASGWDSGYVWKTLQMSVLVPLQDLGPTITVDADGSSTTYNNITCWGYPPFDVQGSVLWVNESWWEADVTFTFLP